MASNRAARVVVFGAGAFGGWTALALVRRGARVTLVDAWGPGNPRSSSGGETRVIRATYGSHATYTRMAARALELWRAHDAGNANPLLQTTGALWLFTRDDPFARASTRVLRGHGIPIDEVSVVEARRRYPQIDFTGVLSVLIEPEAGFLHARRACAEVAERVVAEGGEYLQAAAVTPVRLDGPRVSEIALTNGSAMEADAFVFACGPWLPALFPDAIGSRIQVTRQEVHYFGTPAGDSRFHAPGLPVWLELGERLYYGIPGDRTRTFKVADDSPGPLLDPTTAERAADPERVAETRSFLARRFPALAGAPLVAAEVCQYESTPDAGFVLDRHPEAGNVWIAGGGSGHGFKMGPAVGEHLAARVLGEADPDPQFALRRLDSPPAGGWKPKWA